VAAAAVADQLIETATLGAPEGEVQAEQVLRLGKEAVALQAKETKVVTPPIRDL